MSIDTSGLLLCLAAQRDTLVKLERQTFSYKPLLTVIIELPGGHTLMRVWFTSSLQESMKIGMSWAIFSGFMELVVKLDCVFEAFDSFLSEDSRYV
jgi:hypothetical protein